MGRRCNEFLLTFHGVFHRFYCLSNQKAAEKIHEHQYTQPNNRIQTAAVFQCLQKRSPGLDVPIQGEICYDGKPITTKDLAEHRRHHISLVFQSYNLIDYLTPLENVKLGGKGDPKALLGSMGIGEEYWNRSVLQLSGGQQQRVAIARALASDAKVLLADEPTGNLDEATAWDVIDLLKHIAHEEKKCVIVVTHSKELAQAADEIIHIGSIHAASSKPNF